ncbi:ATP-dependent DNA helicase RecG [Umezakia ovalisporum]|jgi:ATP-dependent DNA helicase RecG|uniref:ATP-dependent DNA helicase RecG n=1 Tax=Umezakia ovalisporum FSS-62 TaxID=2971776 RepID=A0AA43KGA6_9CYAN|nr:ATP-dependent DNA helicase RecG [Umezakia ovalisporum]MBI1241477.1 ATP-dependent DNA helicase RecG [Nostoc sp. RI_552]MDH6064935.1 ATP-dependent DNA helicase RecG [Umezakia ovalisporum FSS-62]MDH6077485.1 ATP-dependent DNA helicase RecG [Umezakia ovalisporum FSS-45]MDH6088644.1 ATP-dependent DNA helicase RecG [Umezakia ovalisporum Ak1311]MDH6103227.1 ATP-dependent DNA helicase RecG [Umezakia ovalisporum ANA283AFssAo]
MTNDKPDWVRLHKALAIEADKGFTDLMGKQYRFSEFLCLTFGKFPTDVSPLERGRWQELAAKFASYPHLEQSQRQHLVAETRRYIYQLQQEPKQSGKEKEQIHQRQKSQPKSPIVAEVNRRLAPNIEQKLRDLPEIGIVKAEKLAALNLYTVRDLLFYYPRDHIDYGRQVNIGELQGGQTVTIIAKVKRCNCFTSPKNKKLSILELIVKDNTGQIKISRFCAGARFASRGWQESLKRRYPVGSILAACGLVKQSKYGLTVDNPELEVLAHPGDTIDSLTIGRVVPIYALTEGLMASTVREAVRAALPATVHLKDPLPGGLREKYGLMELKDAIANIHFPDDSASLQLARRRLVFDEFFYLQLGLLQRQQQAKVMQTSAILAPKGQLIEKFSEILPFQLTNAQQRVVNDILNDLAKSTPMNRLIQGDVGSGKTVVAVIAILAAIQSGYQGALMAPTEVLAEQHYRKLVSWFNLLHLPVELLTGSTKIAKRREIYSQLETGELPLLVGTHALIQNTVNFHQLGLVVIDEQHRFGVKQRALLQQKGNQPHVLTMTATPIPRTLALTIHGDMNVSQIDELPPGRQKIQTTVLTGHQRTEAYDLISREIAQGRQVYIVLPLVEESEKLDLRSAVEEHQKLQETVFPEFRVGLLHGRMSSADKDEAISKFRHNHTQILVSTTVVEVGVDVPNATVMLIENAERFGLSQLHQLRGRVGRGAAKSYCLLMSSSRSPDAQQRLKVLEQSQDGFFISEMDMRFRGPGEVLGTRQSGMPDFTLASLVDDEEVLLLARQAAEKVIEIDGTLERWSLMKAELRYRYERLMGGAILT